MGGINTLTGEQTNLSEFPQRGTQKGGKMSSQKANVRKEEDGNEETLK